MTDSPAAELQAAADKLRTLAAAATDHGGSATWRAARHFPDQPDSDFTSLWAVGGRPLLRGGGGKGRPPGYVHAPVGDYIAAMDPGVGAALADWLERAGDHVRMQALCCDNGEHQCSEIAAPALAVARQINGSQR